MPVKAVLEGVNVPVPLVVQLPVLVAPLTVPLKAASALFAQTKMSLPALTPGASVIVIVS